MKNEHFFFHFLVGKPKNYPPPDRKQKYNLECPSGMNDLRFQGISSSSQSSSVSSRSFVFASGMLLSRTTIGVRILRKVMRYERNAEIQKIPEMRAQNPTAHRTETQKYEAVKTSLKIFTIVIPKEGLTGMTPSILLLV